MDSTTKVIITSIAPAITAIVAIISIYLAKKKITSDTFPNFRYKRLNNIKKTLDNFIDVYFEEANSNCEPANRIRTKYALLKVELHFNYIDSSIYNGLKDVLYKYLESKDIITDHNPLIRETHKLFNWIMAKAKIEAGITAKMEEKYRKILREQYGKCNDCNFHCDRYN